MSEKITANMLYNYVQCPHRLRLDLFGDYSKRDPVSVFIKLLWERGTDFEKQTIENLKLSFLDLSSYSGIEKEKRTQEAMDQGVNLIYSGRISTNELIGEPDLLRREREGYISGDIKSGSGLEGENDFSEGKLKRRYAVQLALYTDILERLNRSGGRTPFIWDVQGREIEYNLDLAQGIRKTESWWAEYKNCLKTVVKIVNQDLKTLPAYSSSCKLCQWHTYCLRYLKKANDLTLIPELGRAKRDLMISYIDSVSDLATIDLEMFRQKNKTIFKGIGMDSLKKFQTRAVLLSQKGSQPYLKSQITLPAAPLELFFDIETDPLRDICYLHGFLVRQYKDEKTEQYISFFADQPNEKEEKQAFSTAWKFIKESRPCIIYYYSSYEKTQYRKLQEKYPEVMSKEELEELFNSKYVVDLYHEVVKKKTEWPTNDYSIKTLATFLGFCWRDKSPSGAESIEWYHCFIKSGDENIKKRILQYNEDDCIASRVLLEGIYSLTLTE